MPQKTPNISGFGHFPFFFSPLLFKVSCPAIVTLYNTLMLFYQEVNINNSKSASQNSQVELESGKYIAGEKAFAFVLIPFCYPDKVSALASISLADVAEVEK